VVGTKPIKLTGFPNQTNTAMELFHQKPLGFGVWGASLLATLPDRSLVSDNLVIGTGQAPGQKHISLVSLVPTHRKCKLPSVTFGSKNQVAILAKVPGMEPCLKKWAVAQFGTNIVEVAIGSMISAKTHSVGIAAEVLQIVSGGRSW
jgi:hypothetical protein